MAMEKFKASPLPMPPVVYDAQYMKQLIRVIELYFRQMDSTTPLTAEYFKGRGDQLTIPHISSTDSTDQFALGNNTPNKVKWGTTESNEAFTIGTADDVYPLYSGIYRMDYSLQFINTANVAIDVYVWLEVNGGIQIANSSSRFTIPARKSIGNYGYLVAYSNVTAPVQAGDAITLWWATEQAASSDLLVEGVYMEHIAAQTSPPYDRPANPSSVGSITFVSALP